MPETLEEMASKGSRKYREKVPAMESGYEAARDYAVRAYEALPFGPTRTGNYRDAWDFMIPNYKDVMKPELADKWRDKWMAKMRV